jgi:Mrp family chromosome partitioning ATPase
VHLHLRGSVRDRLDLRRVTDAPVVAEVALSAEGDGSSQRDVRDLASVVLALRQRQAGPVVVVATAPGGLAPLLAPTLVSALVASGHRVVAVSDPMAAREHETGPSLLQLLAGQDPVPCRSSHPASGLQVVRLGITDDGPVPIIEPSRLQPVLSALAEGADVLIIDAPPLDRFLDGALIGAAVGTTLLVVESGRTTRTGLSRALERLEASSTPIGGVVLATGGTRR